jgi:hypothetical protein
VRKATPLRADSSGLRVKRCVIALAHRETICRQWQSRRGRL